MAVVLPVYNDESRIERAIKSVQAQSFMSWHLFVIDDGSKDKSLEVAQAACEGDGRCEVIRFGHIGLTACLRFSLDYCTNYKYIARLDSDDWMSRDRLVRQLSKAASGDYSLLGTDVMMGSRHIHYPASDAQCRVILAGFRPRNPFAHSSVLLLRSAVVKAGGYGNWKTCQDLDLFLRMSDLEGSRIGNISLPLTYRDEHPGQVSRKAWQRRWDSYRIKINHQLPVWARR